MRILIAPNAFKNSMSADTAAEIIRKGLEESNLNGIYKCFPVGDGGDGTGALLTKKLGGSIEEVLVQNPLGLSLKANFGLIKSSRTAIIEMANASGIRLLDPKKLNPLVATSFGTGMQIKEALERGVKKIIITMGGSATVDGGMGILKALGVRFLDANGKDLPESVASLPDLNFIDLSRLSEKARECHFIILCDVENKLLGEHGTANVFGPQKGASWDQIKMLNNSLARLAGIILRQTGKDISAIKYGGTAGGAAAGLFALLNAELVNGIDRFLQLTDFDSYLLQSDLVITGEGSIDEQTLEGKGPFGVARQAKIKGLPVIGLAGKVPLEQDNLLQEYFDVVIPIGHMPTDLNSALHLTSKNLYRTSRQLGNLLSLAERKQLS